LKKELAEIRKEKRQERKKIKHADTIESIEEEKPVVIS
jgi:hypothetical protein